MLRTAAVLLAFTSPAAATTCAEYDQRLGAAVVAASEALGCTNLSAAEWEQCIAAGVFLGGSQTFVDTMRSLQDDPDYRACFPERPNFPL